MAVTHWWYAKKIYIMGYENKSLLVLFKSIIRLQSTSQLFEKKCNLQNMQDCVWLSDFTKHMQSKLDFT